MFCFYFHFCFCFCLCFCYSYCSDCCNTISYDLVEHVAPVQDMTVELIGLSLIDVELELATGDAEQTARRNRENCTRRSSLMSVAVSSVWCGLPALPASNTLDHSRHYRCSCLTSRCGSGTTATTHGRSRSNGTRINSGGGINYDDDDRSHRSSGSDNS